jgi:hypothetical protein
MKLFLESFFKKYLGWRYGIDGKAPALQHKDLSSNPSTTKMEKYSGLKM